MTCVLTVYVNVCVLMRAYYHTPPHLTSHISHTTSHHLTPPHTTSHHLTHAQVPGDADGPRDVGGTAETAGVCAAAKGGQAAKAETAVEEGASGTVYSTEYRHT